MFTKSLLRILTLTAMILTIGNVQAESKPIGVDKLKEVVEDKAKTILRFAHPLGKFKAIEYDSYRKKGNAHEVTYVCTWMGKENRKPKEFITKYLFSFTVDADGDVDTLTLTIPMDTCKSAPFKAAGFTLGVLRALVKRQLGFIIGKEEAGKIVKGLDAKGLVAVYLKYLAQKQAE